MINKKACIWIPLVLFIFNIGFAQIPSGFYFSAIGKSGDSLKSALNIITKTGHIKLSYGDVWSAYAYTDVRPNDTTKIWDMYSDIPNGIPPYLFTIFVNQNAGGGANSEGDSYAREHCLPNSWWGHYDFEQYTDLHNLNPADQYVNNKKSNNPLGVTTSPLAWVSLNGSKVGFCTYPGYTGKVFEPINEFKGDFARAWFYIATRYQDSLSAWVKNYKSPEAIACIDSNTNNFKPWLINLLISWNNNDPVSTKEINRNNAIYYKTNQHNRNPYIDHPEYVNYIWGGQSPTLKAKPTNQITNFICTTIYPENSTIKLDWSDATGGVLPDGYLIKASTKSFDSIINPRDSVPEIGSLLVKNIAYGIQTTTFDNLNYNTVYYFKIFPFTNSLINIKYNLNSPIPITKDTTIWKEDFEIGTKANYANGNANCTMGNWQLNDALIGSLPQDKKNGNKCLRAGSFTIYMNFDKSDGVGNITLYQARYSNDATTYWKFFKSTDNGINWILIKDTIFNNQLVLNPITIFVNEPNPVRFKLLSYNGNRDSKRSNIDDIIITNYFPPTTYKTLNIKCFLEGLFNGSNMNQAQNEFGNQFSTNIADKITVELRDSISPFAKVFSDTNVMLDINGNALIDTIPQTLNGKYYIVLKHRNHIETWSSATITLTNDTTFYDFTDLVTKAYGDNLKFIQNSISNKSQLFSNINQLKSNNYNPERFIISINKTNEKEIFEVIVFDKFTKKKYIKKVHENVLFNKSNK